MATTRNSWRNSNRGTGSSRGWNSGSGWSNSWNSSYGGNYGSSSRSTTSSTSYSPTQFSNVREQCQQRVTSYRTIASQCSGPGRVNWFSPSTANKFVRFVNNGCLVYKFSNPQFCRSFGSQFSNTNSTTAFRLLKNKFGTGIKAVTRGKNNCWLVCASSNVSARPFSQYNWD
ncbi:MAG: hypothetical protein JNG88_08160 [Phycisphaerales bacterium]|nr:hypothetical protein [Phycisphaerales bacterium]